MNFEKVKYNQNLNISLPTLLSQQFLSVHNWNRSQDYTAIPRGLAKIIANGYGNILKIWYHKKSRKHNFENSGLLLKVGINR